MSVYTKFKGMCRNCGKQGHKSIDCRSKRPTLNDEKKKYNKDIKCYNCGKNAGHIAKDCPEPKRERNVKTETGIFLGVCIEIDKEMLEKNANYEMEITYSEEEDSAEFKAFFVCDKPARTKDVCIVKELNENPMVVEVSS